MKLPGVSGVYDYAGPDRNSRYRSRPCCLPPMQKRQRPDCIFSELNTQPTCTPVYASPNTSRCATQNSGPSGSLLLSRRTLSFPASCRFIPAHYIGDNPPIENSFMEMRTTLFRTGEPISSSIYNVLCTEPSAIGYQMEFFSDTVSWLHAGDCPDEKPRFYVQVNNFQVAPHQDQCTLLQLC